MEPCVVMVLTALMGGFGCREGVPLVAPPAARPIPEPEREVADVDLQALIDQTGDGGEVRLAPVRYVLAEGLRIDGRRRLTLRGAAGTQIMVNNVNADVVRIRNSADIRISDLLLRHVEPLREYDCHGDVVAIVDSRDIAVVNGELNGCGAIGLSAWNSDDILVQDC